MGIYIGFVESTRLLINMSRSTKDASSEVVAEENASDNASFRESSRECSHHVPLKRRNMLVGAALVFDYREDEASWLDFAHLHSVIFE